MQKIAKNFYKNLSSMTDSVRVTNKEDNILDFFEGIEMVSRLIMSQADSGHKIIFIGNGASAAISSHIATDFWKNCGIRAVAFNDSSLLTSISNDYGYKYVFEKPIKMFTDNGDILFAISCSGQSENILFGAKAARAKRAKIITLSGFDENNPLRKSGEFNFYVPSASYGYVEIVHLSICHCMVNIIIEEKNR